MKISKCGIQVALIIAAVVVCGVLSYNSEVETKDDSSFVHTDSHAQRDASISAADIAARYGYNFESHRIQTDDGYILSLHRIPSTRKGNSSNSTPILLHHGLLGCSADWIVQGPGRSIGLILADSGYDVWLANARGTTESKTHVSLNTTDWKYWDFSWHEIGYYDLPAEIDYILKKTGRKSLSYMGYSQGTTVFWVLGSERSDYMSKVDKMVALAPVAYFQRLPNGLFRSLASLVTNMEWVATTIGHSEFLPTNKFMSWATRTFCKDDAWTQELCKNVVFLLLGFTTHLNASLLPTIFAYCPAGASTKQVLHYAQQIRHAPSFRLYNYGWIGNLYKYGTVDPPIYNLRKVSVPVHIYVGPQDDVANEMDSRRLYGRLRRRGQFKVVSRKDFNHIDFLLASDAHQLLYNDVLKILRVTDTR